MSLIKDIYNKSYYQFLANEFKTVYPAFDADRFVKQVMPNGFKQMEWKERLNHTTATLHDFLPGDFKTALNILLDVMEHLQNQGIQHRLEYIFFPQYIADYGLSHFKLSLNAFERVTQFISCEFAIRPFIIEDADAVLKIATKWTRHKSEHVRRLASEGIRPRLPWGMAIPAFKKNPAPLFPVLSLLMNDSSAYVRKSVANHLNDISKDHPEEVLKFLKGWKGTSPQTDQLIKHALRTLLKAGHAGVLDFYQLDASNIICSSFKLKNKKVQIGNDLFFEAVIENKAAVKQYVRLEYAVYFKRLKHLSAKKVFKITEKEVYPDQLLDIQKKHSFKLITTRNYYPGKHQISIIVNGKELDKLDFTLS
jgi:3-methyladenine DNA glycosylase AlkC